MKAVRKLVGKNGSNKKPKTIDEKDEPPPREDETGYEMVLYHDDVNEAVKSDRVPATNAYVKTPKKALPRLETVDEKGRTWLKENELVMFHGHQLRKGSNVFYGQRLLNSGRLQHVAIKLIRYGDQDLDKWKSFQKLRHQNIMQVLEWGEYHVFGHWIFLVMEICEQNLRQYVEECSHGSMELENFTSIFNQLLHGLEYIQQNAVLHQDIKPDNVWIDRGDKIKIGGFSFPVYEQKDHLHWKNDGYRPPEMYQPNARLTNSSDVFQLALVVAYLISMGKHPFGLDSCEQSYNIKKHKDLDLSIIPELGLPNSRKRDELISLLGAMLQQCPKDRPSMNKIRSDAFFKPLPGTVAAEQQNKISLPRRQPSAKNPSDNEYIALYDFKAQEDDDLSFNRRDRFIILDDTEGDWWKVRLIKSGEEGYIPSNYIKAVYSIYSEEWFFGDISRKECEELLLDRKNMRGTFLIRESESKPGSYTLSIIDHDPLRRPLAKHYIILRLKIGLYSIDNNKQFRTLKELVQHHTGAADGLCCRLTTPCPRDGENDGLHIPKNQLKIERKVASGNFGDVHKGFWNDKEVAIKTYKKEKMSPDEFLMETHMMRLMRHDKLVSLYGVVYEDPIYIVTEWMCNGSLKDYLKKGSGTSCAIEELIDMAAQIAAGMEYMEKRKYIHRDLRAANILVGNLNQCKIADFGLARIIQEEEYQSREDSALPMRWMAPEVSEGGICTIKSDVWSFGILLTEIVSKGDLPYKGIINSLVYVQVKAGWRIPKHENCPEALYKMMEKCWYDKALDRPTFKQLKKFLEEYFSSDDHHYMNMPAKNIDGCGNPNE